jgi:DNA ligase 1
MNRFAHLLLRLEETTKTLQKVSALRNYFEAEKESEEIFGLALLLGKTPRRILSGSTLRRVVAEKEGIPLWLVEECYHFAGDLADALTLLMPQSTSKAPLSLQEAFSLIHNLQKEKEDERIRHILPYLTRLGREDRYLVIKLITGGLRVGVARGLVVRAFAEGLQKSPAEVDRALLTAWVPGTTTLRDLFKEDKNSESINPYPFFLASPLEGGVEALGRPDQWSAEWKWDGIRVQVLCQKGTISLWSRGEEYISDAFSELSLLMRPGHDVSFVLDGELLVGTSGLVRPFHHLQKRLGRKSVTQRVKDEYPVHIRAYDLLEKDGTSLLKNSYEVRRQALECLIATSLNQALIIASERLRFTSWDELTKLRARAGEIGAEGLILKRNDSPYLAGRVRGTWWKWKVDPFTVDAVLVYAQRGHGRRATLYTDYTFAVWNAEGELVPCAKAYSGLTDKEIVDVDKYIQRHTVSSHGPMRVVEPHLVFEIAFEGILPSSRHKAGVALRFPRIVRQRFDKSPRDADTLESLQKLLKSS